MCTQLNCNTSNLRVNNIQQFTLPFQENGGDEDGPKFPAFFCFIFILFSVFLILLTVTVCVTIVCTYFLLNAEDYR